MSHRPRNRTIIEALDRRARRRLHAAGGSAAVERVERDLARQLGLRPAYQRPVDMRRQRTQ